MLLINYLSSIKIRKFFNEKKYVDFISDKHFLNCIANIYKAYLKAKSNISKKNFLAIR